MKKQTPPKLAVRFLAFFLKNKLLEEVLGDLEEKFQLMVEKSTMKARLNYWFQVLKYLRPFAIKKMEHPAINSNLLPLYNYLLVAFRVCERYKRFTLINILGLSSAISATLFIYLWAQDELKYNKYLEEGEHVFQVVVNEMHSSGEITTSKRVPYELKEILDEQYPMVEKSAILSKGNWMAFTLDEEMIEFSGVDASSEIFELFEMSIVSGSYKKMDEHTNTIAISTSFAEIYFGDDWKLKHVIGSVLEDKLKGTFEVVAVYEDFPTRSTIKYDFIVPYAHLLKRWPAWKSWRINQSEIFVKLADSKSEGFVDQALRNVINDHTSVASAPNQTVFLQSFESLYLYNRYENGIANGGRVQYVRLLVIGAVFILLLASFNFMNITTARSSQRLKETGVRKTLGASKQSLHIQFLIEACLITFFSVLISLVIVTLLSSPFAALTGKQLTIEVISFQNVGYLIVFMFTLGILTGLYPSFYLSSVNTLYALKGNVGTGRGNAPFRRFLVFFQFAITVFMISGALIIYKQVMYIQQKNTGMDRSNLIRTYSYEMNNKKEYQTYKSELLKRPGIESVTLVNQLLINVRNSTSEVKWDGKLDANERSFYLIDANPDFLPTTKIAIKEGRNFDWNIASDTANYLINETAQKLIGLANPLGESLTVWNQKGKIIGVVEDFNNASLHSGVKPLIIRNDMIHSWMVLARSKEGMNQEAIASLEEVFRMFNNPKRQFWFRFMDEVFNAQYKSERLVGKLAWWFTVIAMIISLLGLFSLVAYTTERRTKEVGIRKTLGASLLHILGLLAKEHIILVGLALLFGIPIAYYVGASWLDNFSYRMELEWWVFAVSAFVIVTITGLVIVLNIAKAASINPIKYLRNE